MYVLNKYVDMLCFYAFIVQNSFGNEVLLAGCAQNVTHVQLTVTVINIDGFTFFNDQI